MIDDLSFDEKLISDVRILDVRVIVILCKESFVIDEREDELNVR